MWKRRDTNPAPDDAGDLTQLIEAERRLDAMLAETRRRAAELVQDAKTMASARATDFEAQMVAAAAELGQAVECETRNRVEEIEQRAADAVTRYQLVTDDRVKQLVDYVIARAIAFDGSRRVP